MGAGQAGLGMVQKKAACVQFDTLDFEVLIWAGAVSNIQMIFVSVYECQGMAPLPLHSAFHW